MRNIYKIVKGKNLVAAQFIFENKPRAGDGGRKKIAGGIPFKINL